MQRYWVISPYDSTEKEIFNHAWEYDLQNGTIALGWETMGNILNLNLTEAEYYKRYIERYGKDSPYHRKSFWTFINNVAIGDVIVARKGRKSIIGIGEVKKTTYFDENKGRERIGFLTSNYYSNFIDVVWDKQNIQFKEIVFPIFTIWEISKGIFELLLKNEHPMRPSKSSGKGGGVKMIEAKSDLNEIEFDKSYDEEAEAIDIETSKRKVYTDQGDPEIESLHGKYKRGKLIVQPDFQRYFVWDVSKSSRLIESALMDIPIPVIYLSEEKDGKEYVIDGQQRLTAFFSFIDGKLPDNKDFKLTGLKIFRELNGKFFKELKDEFQDKVRYCKIRTITFRQESEKDLKFEIFERLNTGAVSLNDQELRNCIYRGSYNLLLRELSRDPDFVYLMGIKNPDKRMKDVELVLRFTSFYHKTYLNYRPPIRQFLNDDMEEYKDISDSKAGELKNAFKNSMAIIKSLLGDNAFKRFYVGDKKNPNGSWEPKKFNASLYDILAYSFAREDKNKVYQNLDSIREALIFLMTSDDEFIDSIERSTSSHQAVTKRFDKWRMALQGIIGVSQKESRCFSLKLKKDLFDNDPTCSICGQRIRLMDDAAIDHIEQYWMGGRTIPENARLTHRYCNWARPRKDDATGSN